MRNRRRWPWLVAAAVLVAAGAWLMSLRDVKRPEPVWKRVEMPRRMTRAERQRAEERRTLPAPAPVETPPQTPPVPERPRDPMLAAMPSTFERGMVVVEANAVRHSPVGQLLLDCFVSRDGGKALDTFRQATGINPLDDVDRVAVVDESLIVSGHFAGADWKKVFEQDGVPHGRQGTIYADGDDAFFGVWNNQLVVAAETRDGVRAALDRVEGKGDQAPPAFDESLTYGEIYGVLNAARFAEALPPEQAALAERLRAAAAKVELHVDTTRDVGIVADVTGPSARETEDLGKALGAALAVGRLQAQAEGQAELVELMDLARVVPEDGQFRMEMGLPLEVLEKHLRECVRRNEERRAQSPAAPEPDP